MSLFTVTSQGVITVDTSSVRADFAAAYTAALGADLNTDVSTPTGQLITNDTTAITTAMQECVNMANENNVYFATGQALDVAAAFYGYYRKQGVPTTVVATVTGSSGVSIPAGSIVSDGENQYRTLSRVTIPSTGSASVECQCTVTGPIACPAGSLTKIVTTISGWDGVTNQYDGITGYATESDNTFRDRVTANFLNKRARAIMGAIIDNVAALNDVISVVGGENPFNVTQTVDGIEMPPHSIYLTVLGGNESEIAQVMAAQKTMGAETIGNTEVGYTDPDINYKYTYKIYRPAPVRVYAQIQYNANVYTPANVSEQIKQLVSDYVANNPFRVGQTVSGNTLATALDGYNKIDLLAIKVSANGTDWADYIATTKTQVAILSAGDISTTEI